MALVALAVWRVGSDEPYRADLSPRTAAPTARAGAAASVTQELVRALAAGDADAAADLAPAGDDRARALLGAVAHNARDLRLTDLSARYVDEVGAVSSDGSWTAALDLTWALDGFDQQPARAEVLAHFAPDGQGVAVTDLGGGDRISPTWLRGRLAVRRTPDVLVMAGGDQASREARGYLQRVRRAIPVVRRVLPGWRPAVVVEVPASPLELDHALGVAEGTYTDIAAVTAAADGDPRAGGPVRVFVNPVVTGRLRGAGAQVVISHELTHVATDATTAAPDPWLQEGFADYVALRDVDLPVTTTAGRAIASVRRDGVPDGLPGPADFDTSATDLEAAYELAWLACVEIAAEAGERGLVRVYRAAAGGASTTQALGTVGLTRAEVLRGWQESLSRLAS
ncbi:hypothetical protein C7S10_12715 [Nocardioides currus]|uniref:Peptidase MA-like domain-containing protein n=1 Tax=Nocardioides currus TaxID=2133958 RepID=A0A2R7YW60_9ACTN|nr:hypothetical protein C7S10_12715 [Nocardioides currus]